MDIPLLLYSLPQLPSGPLSAQPLCTLEFSMHMHTRIMCTWQRTTVQVGSWRDAGTDSCCVVLRRLTYSPSQQGQPSSPSLSTSSPIQPSHKARGLSQWWCQDPEGDRASSVQIDQPQVLPAKLRPQALVLFSNPLHVQAQCWVGG